MSKSQTPTDPEMIAEAHARMTHSTNVIQGFATVSIVATFIAAIQAQVMSTTLGIEDPPPAIQAVNAFYMGGLILDLMSAFISFLTGRWLQRLTGEELDHFEVSFSDELKEAERTKQKNVPPPPLPLYIKYLAFCLFSGFSLVVLGCTCMLVGILIYVWAWHPIPVAVVVTATFVIPLPFLVGLLLIGREPERRRLILSRLGQIRGDW